MDKKQRLMVLNAKFGGVQKLREFMHNAPLEERLSKSIEIAASLGKSDTAKRLALRLIEHRIDKGRYVDALLCAANFDLVQETGRIARKLGDKTEFELGYAVSLIKLYGYHTARRIENKPVQ